MDRFEEKIVRLPEGGCHVWVAALNSGGYGVFRTTSKEQKKAHRVAWELTNGPIPDGLQLRHRCDNQCCVNPHHLEIGTQQDNEDDKTAKLRQARKLEPVEIYAIRADKRSTRVVGAAYGISSMMVSDIRRRKWWRHLPELN